MGEVYLRFDDLKAMGVVQNWMTLKRWVLKEGFPPGVMLAANTRAWPKSEIEAWLAERPAWKGRK